MGNCFGRFYAKTTKNRTKATTNTILRKQEQPIPDACNSGSCEKIEVFEFVQQSTSTSSSPSRSCAPLADVEEDWQSDKMASENGIEAGSSSVEESDHLNTPSGSVLEDVLGELLDGPPTAGAATVVTPSSPSTSSQSTPTVTPQASTLNASFAAPSNPTQRKFTNVMVNGITFAIPDGYQTRLSFIGGGAFGNVVKTTAKKQDGEDIVVAVKKFREPFLDVHQARRIYREIKLLQLMRHDNIINAIDLYTPDAVEHRFKDVYVVTEFAGTSLFKVLREQKDLGHRHILPEHVVFIIYQLLRAVKYIHSGNIMHRDLKPGNLAITVDSDLTVLDFGLARNVHNDDTTKTQYVMTRWYRSPEVIYWNIDSYDQQADIWSVGCIAAELMSGQPLFPGEDAQAQYDMITKLCGSPDEELLDKIRRSNNEEMVMVIQSFDQHARVNFQQVFGRYGESFVDFLDRILVLDPTRRITVEEALQHAFVAEFSYPEDEPVAETPFVLGDQPNTKLDEWKGIIWQEIQNFVRVPNSPVIPP